MKSEDSRRPAYQKIRLQLIGHRAIQARVNEALSVHGLNTSQWILLGWLYDTGGGLRVSALAEVLEVEVPLVTNLLQSLHGRRLISMRADPDDRRAKLVRLTEKGAGLVPRLEIELHERLKVFDRSLRPGEMHAYFKALEHFIRAGGLSPD